MKHLVRTIIWTAITVWLLTFVLLRIPAVQTALADKTRQALAEKLGTRVEVGRVDIRLLNRIIVDNFSVYDQQQKQMLRAGRVSVTVELLPLLEGEISISSAQLFGMKANIYRKDAASPLNCQFAIDSLKSKDTTSTTPLNLCIASLIIRNGALVYDQQDQPQVARRFSPYHINISHLSSHIILNRLTDDSLNVSLKRLSLSELSGLRINNLSFDAKASQGAVSIKDMRLQLPKTHIAVSGIRATFLTDSSGIRPGTLRLNGSIRAEKFSLSDISALLPGVDTSAIPTLQFTATAEGTDRQCAATLFVSSKVGNDLVLQASATATDILTHPKADILLSRLSVAESLMTAVSSFYGMPPLLTRLGAIDARGRYRWHGGKRLTMDTDISASRVGKITIDGEYNDNDISANIKTASFNLAQLTDIQQFGSLKCKLYLKAHTNPQGHIASGMADGTVEEMTYGGYTYHNATMNLTYADDVVSGKFNIQDPNIRLDINGKAGIGSRKSLHANAVLSDFCPSALNLTGKFPNERFNLTLMADASGSTIDNASGIIRLEDITISDDRGTKPDSRLDSLMLSIGRNVEGEKQLTLSSDFARLNISGRFTPSSLPTSFTNLAAMHLPAAKELPAVRPNNNAFTFSGYVKDLDFVKRLVNIPVDIDSTLTVEGYIRSEENSANISLTAPSLNVKGTRIDATDIKIWTEYDALRARLVTRLQEKNGPVAFDIDCQGKDNSLLTSVTWDNMRRNIFRGQVNTVTQFTPTIGRHSDATISIPHSTFAVGDTLWHIQSRGIHYEGGRLSINHLAVENDNQHLLVNGTASASAADTLTAELKNINIRYILDLVNFHSVDFDGSASGTATASGIMQHPVANADLTINDFKFENGLLGTMRLLADYDNDEGRINLSGKADRDGDSILVDGYISPAKNTIDLGMRLYNTPLDFLRTYCSSFLNDIDLSGNGHLRLHGLLSAINLGGQIVAKGGITLSSTACRYTLDGDTVTFVPDDILFRHAPIRDRFGNTAYLTGGIHHHNLGRISYDITATTQKLLAYDFPTLTGDDTYCGYTMIDGEIGIHGRGNELNITADCTPLPGSYFTYNASSPEALRSQDFVTWGSASEAGSAMHQHAGQDAKAREELLDAGNDRTNIHLNFLVNVTPEARLHLIMDNTTGDYVDLFGTGALRVQYYNKGSLDIFGNYTVDHGTYKMTIQNLMRRDFAFQKGGTIAFTGDPYIASLNLQAAYMLNSVSLADLNIGSSFKSNTVPVNCLMDITGTPGQPKVDFGMDLPSLSSDARQMVYSIINSEEEMNQQVLYLLTIGRFYSQQTEGDNAQRTNQGTLAMQSFLSGTLSQQLSGFLSQVTGKTNWSLGANITPGADGFNNGVYEGLLSGRMFNNRLIFNGQFGYRDNINTDTQNFIGDFTLQYLLTPNGNFAIKMYNQANDRYFTRSSLNTQGIGIVLQKEFGK